MIARRDIVFCPQCGYIVEDNPTYRQLGWYRTTYSVCPLCDYFGYLRVGKTEFSLTHSFNFIFTPPKLVLRCLREKFKSKCVFSLAGKELQPFEKIKEIGKSYLLFYDESRKNLLL